jgi:protein TonB
MGVLISIVFHVAVIFAAGVVILSPPPAMDLGTPKPTIRVALGAVPKSVGHPRPPSVAALKPPLSEGTSTPVKAEESGWYAGKAVEERVPQSDGAGPVESKSLPSAMGDVDAEPVGDDNPIPIYPEVARRRGQEGTVVLVVEIDSNGVPTRVEVKRSSGFRLLDLSATKTVIKWRFSPAKLGGRPVTSTLELPIRFQLKEYVGRPGAALD